MTDGKLNQDLASAARIATPNDAAASVVLAVDPSRSTPDEPETVASLRAALATERATLERRCALLRSAQHFADDVANAAAQHGEQDDEAIALGDAIRTELADTPEAG